jgi:hypothetical protein
LSFIKSRLRSLEEHIRGGRCQECGLLPDGQGYIVLIDEEDRERSFQGDPDDRCKRCGRFLYTVIQVVYGSPAVDEGGGDSYWPHAPE